MTYFFYDVLLFLAYLLYLPVYCLRGRLHSGFFARLGFFGQDAFAVVRGRDTVWIHAVSVGEARAAESLLRLIRASWPQKRVAVSTVTSTGQAIVKKLLNENEVAFYAPLDISFAVGSCLRAVSPGLVIIMETEIWPNLIRLSKRRGAPVVIVNGRISDKSYRRYERIKPFLRETIGHIDLFCMQTEEAARRIIALGADRERVRVTGNIKFDISADLNEPPAALLLKKALKDCLLLTAGSTHDNEEEALVSMYKSLRKDFGSLRLLLAPRHLERIDKIRRMIRLQGLQAVNLSRMSQDAAVSQATVLIVDTMGDLNALYRVSDIAFVGGSLVPKGGHNPIEPALFGKPILFGKYMDNFREIRDIFIRQEAAIEVDTFQRLEYEVRRLLASPAQRQALGERAGALIDQNRGAAMKTFSAVREFLKI